MNSFKRHNFLSYISCLPNVKMKERKDGKFHITYKSEKTYFHSWDIWNQLKKEYEAYFNLPIATDDVNLQVFEKYIVV